MPKYIDAEKLIDFKFAYITNERYKDGRRKSEEEIYAYKVGYNEAIDNIIQFATTADVFPVVRCKECWKRNDEDFCPLVSDNCYPPTLSDDWFCADGERRTDVQG